MKIDFNDKSFIEIKRTADPDKITIVISAIDHNNTFKKIINSCEITTEQFKALISDI